MRESIGGTWILSIVMTFLMLFTAYLAVSVNYAKAFRVKTDFSSGAIKKSDKSFVRQRERKRPERGNILVAAVSF